MADNEAGRTRLPSIFLLTRSLDVGGTQRQLVEFAKGLRRRGHKVQVGLFYGGGAFASELEQSGVELVDLRKGGRWDLLRFGARLIRQLKRSRPDVIYSFLGSANIVATIARQFIPRTPLVWSVRASNVDLTRYGRVHRFGYKAECALARLADSIIANSSAGAAVAVRDGFPADKIKVIPNGIDTDRFRPDAALRATTRREFGLGDRDVAIGVLGRLEQLKGQETFLEAARIAAGKSDALRFLCIGDGPDRCKLQSLAEKLGITDRVIFTGEQDPVTALNALDIACSPSITEGFSNAIAEAMACGLPCVVTDVGDSAAIVGQDGIVVPPHSPEALAAALLAQAGRLDQHDAARPRARIVENFSVDAMVERTLEVFRSLRPGDRP